jgi:hypothetical protein
MIIQLNVSNDWTLFAFIRQFNSLLRSQSEKQLIATIHKGRLNFFEANKFDPTIKFLPPPAIEFYPQQNFLR